jgi:hypothetical protein
MKTLILSLVFLSSVYAQASAAGKVSSAGATQMSAAQQAPFNVLNLSTQNPLAPSAGLFPGFPTVAGGNPAEGYQGGIYINGLALFTPWQWQTSIKQGTLLAYRGGASGTFACPNSTSCAANWDWFDMTTLALNCPSGYAPCPSQDSATGYVGLVLANNIVYYTPDAANQFPVFMAFNPFGPAGSGGTSVSNPANYTYFSAPAAGSSPLGRTYGWCTGVFDGQYVYYSPTDAGGYKNTDLIRYNTTGAGGFALANFQNFDLSTLPGGTLNGGFESSAFDGQKIYLLPTNGGDLVVYDTTQSFTNAGGTSYKVLNLANLGTSAVTYIAPVDMTSNTAPSPYVASASTNYPAGGFLPWNAFDGTLGVPGWTGTNHGSDWLQIYLGSPWLLQAYAIVVSGASRAPTAWTMQGSNNGTTWTTVDTQTGQTAWTAGVLNTYTPAAPVAAYAYYRLNIMAGGDGTYTNVGQLYLYSGSYPQVTGNGNLHAIHAQNDYIGGQVAWNPAGTTEYLYLAPFGANPGQSSHANTIVSSNVLRVPVATCSPGTPGAQTCIGTFTALDITASSSIWEIFDLANLAANQAWAAARLAYPPLYTPPSPLANQLTLGAFQLTWLNVHSTADPVVGFVADYGNFYMRHHVSHTLSDPSGWDLAQRPAGQANGCMGGGYDPANQLLYVACPAATPTPSAWQIGPL